jgi:hypothetical protein
MFPLMYMRNLPPQRHVPTKTGEIQDMSGMLPLIHRIFRSPIACSFKGTVSPDIGLQFRFWKFKLVLYAGLLLVFTFFYFIVP